jgi:thioredoxin 1
MRTYLRKAAITAAIVSAALTGSAQTHQIYSDTADAHAEIKDALAKAATEHKRVILDFGGNWCGDCKALDYYFHDPANAALLAQNYVLVDIDIGSYDRNKDLADKYQVPLEKGVPALAVLDARGRVLYSQRNGEFEEMRTMESSSVTEFLNQWKPRP